MNVGLVPRRDGNGGTIPFEKTLIDSVDVLNDGKLEMQSRFRDWFSDRFAELRDDHLFGLVNGVEASEQGPQNRDPPARSTRTKGNLACSSFLQGVRVERKDREQVSHRIVDDNLLTGRWEHITHRFEIKSACA